MLLAGAHAPPPQRLQSSHHQPSSAALQQPPPPATDSLGQAPHWYIAIHATSDTGRSSGYELEFTMFSLVAIRATAADAGCERDSACSTGSRAAPVNTCANRSWSSCLQQVQASTCWSERERAAGCVGLRTACLAATGAPDMPPYPSGRCWFGMRMVSLAYMAVSDKRPFARLMSPTCSGGSTPPDTTGVHLLLSAVHHTGPKRRPAARAP
jgi:hypothetical protein